MTHDVVIVAIVGVTEQERVVIHKGVADRLTAEGLVESAQEQEVGRAAADKMRVKYGKHALIVTRMAYN